MNLLLWLLVAGACARTSATAETPEEGTSFREGLLRLCEVDRRAGLDADLDPVTIEGARYDWALSNVENPDVIEMVTLMRVRSPAERVQMLRAGSSQANLETCPLADTLSAP